MSIATTKKENSWKKETVGSTAVRVVQKTARAVQNDLFGILAIFAVIITGIGQFFELSLYWYLLTVILIGLAFYREYRPPEIKK